MKSNMKVYCIQCGKKHPIESLYKRCPDPCGGYITYTTIFQESEPEPVKKSRPKLLENITPNELPSILKRLQKGESINILPNGTVQILVNGKPKESRTNFFNSLGREEIVPVKSSFLVSAPSGGFPTWNHFGKKQKEKSGKKSRKVDPKKARAEIYSWAIDMETYKSKETVTIQGYNYSVYLLESGRKLFCSSSGTVKFTELDGKREYL